MNRLQRHFFASPPRKSVCQNTARIIKPKPDDIQCGFRRGRSITEQISTLQQIFKKSWEHAIYTCFVNLGKIYGRVPRKKLWWVLLERGVDECLLLAVK